MPPAVLGSTLWSMPSRAALAVFFFFEAILVIGRHMTPAGVLFVSGRCVPFRGKSTAPLTLLTPVRIIPFADEVPGLQACLTGVHPVFFRTKRA